MYYYVKYSIIKLGKLKNYFNYEKYNCACENMFVNWCNDYYEMVGNSQNITTV